VAHFIGAVKPWSLSYNRATKSVETAEEEPPHVVDFVNVWWQIFIEDIHYRLIANLASDQPLMTNSSEKCRWDFSCLSLLSLSL